MRFPSTPDLIEESRRFDLRSACCDCFFYVQVASERRCAHEWPDVGQSRWPLDVPGPDGAPAREVEFCKEFELA